MSERVKLSGPDRSSSTVYFDDSGQLVIEFHDWSSTAEDMMGGEVVTLLYVDSAAIARVAILLGVARDDVPSAFADRNESWFSVKTWLEREGVQFRKAVPHFT